MTGSDCEHPTGLVNVAYAKGGTFAGFMCYGCRGYYDAKGRAITREALLLAIE